MTTWFEEYEQCEQGAKRHYVRAELSGDEKCGRDGKYEYGYQHGEEKFGY